MKHSCRFIVLPAILQPTWAFSQPLFIVFAAMMQPTWAFSQPLVIRDATSAMQPACSIRPSCLDCCRAQPVPRQQCKFNLGTGWKQRRDRAALLAQRPQENEAKIEVSTKLDDERVKRLFAWLNRAFAGDARYNNLMLAFAAVYGDVTQHSLYSNTLTDMTKRPGAADALVQLVNDALAKLPADEDAPVGEPISLRERERGCLGAMGAGQWTGQWRTRPHALLDVRQFSSVDEWVQTLPRGARRTLAKANAQDFSVVSRPIYGDQPAPHSSLAHFRCVVQHELRLLADTDVLEALQHAISRYQNCVSQGGEIREYRDDKGRVIGFAQEVTKGKVMRGQWFYATDAGAKSFVWFHSVQELVARAIADEQVHFADLGPSGSDAFSDLKHKYGFQSVEDWHTVTDYRGPFRYSYGSGQSWAELDPPDFLFSSQ